MKKKIAEIKVTLAVGVFKFHLLHRSRRNLTMKNGFIFLVSFAVFTFMINGCQDPLVDIVSPPDEEVFTLNHPVADLVQRTTLKDGSFDNIIDESSCISIVLPVTVRISEMLITLNSEEDFEVVEAIFDETNDDDLSIVFPIRVILANYMEADINNEDELQDVVKDCVENGDDADIECVDLTYPLSASVFNTSTQIAETITFTTDKELHQFVTDLEKEDLVGMEFPITLTTFDGKSLVANENEELKDIIESSIESCDEDDDNDFNDDDDPDNPELVSVLLSGNWIISYFFETIDGTADFAGYVFTFAPNGTALADNGSTQINGVWQSKKEDNGSRELRLKFGETSPFVKLEDDWDVLEFDSTTIRLMDEDTPESSKRFLDFKRQ